MKCTNVDIKIVSEFKYNLLISTLSTLLLLIILFYTLYASVVSYTYIIVTGCSSTLLHYRLPYTCSYLNKFFLIGEIKYFALLFNTLR